MLCSTRFATGSYNDNSLAETHSIRRGRQRHTSQVTAAARFPPRQKAGFATSARPDNQTDSRIIVILAGELGTPLILEISECRVRLAKTAIMGGWVPGVPRRAIPRRLWYASRDQRVALVPEAPKSRQHTTWPDRRTVHTFHSQPGCQRAVRRATRCESFADIVDRLYHSVPRRCPPTAPLARPGRDTNLTPPRLCNDS